MKHESNLGSIINQDTPISITTPLLNSSSLHKKAQEMIRKKASLYGFQELSNPLLYDRLNIITSIILPVSRTHLRTKSNLVTVESRHAESFHKKVPSQETTKTQERVIKNHSISNHNQLEAIPKRINLFPELNKLENLIHNEKEIIHIFKEKLDTDINDVVFEYLKILSLSISKESELNSNVLSPEKSILIPTMEFICESMFECQFDKMTLLLASVAVSLCEFYKLYEKIGKFLFLIAKVLRKMSRFQETIIILKKALEYVWYGRRKINELKDTSLIKMGEHEPHIKTPSHHKDFSNISISNQSNTESILITTELEIYNELSYCLLQLNEKKESHTFAQKYEIGYLERENSSSVMGLSRDLIISAQKRVVSWQRVDEKRIYMMIGCDLNKYLETNKEKIMKKFNENLLLKDFNGNIDLMVESLLKKEMFFYEIPLMTEFKDHDVESYKKSHSTTHRKGLEQRFVFKSKSTHNRSSSIPVENEKKMGYTNESVGESKIFNYRGIGLSRTKLVDLLKTYINLIKKRNEEEKKEFIQLKFPQLGFDRKESKKKHTLLEENNQLGSKLHTNSRKKTVIDSLVD